MGGRRCGMVDGALPVGCPQTAALQGRAGALGGPRPGGGAATQARKAAVCGSEASNRSGNDVILSPFTSTLKLATIRCTPQARTLSAAISARPTPVPFDS